MAPTVQTCGLKTEGIEVLSPVDPSFNSTTRSLFRGDVDELLRLKLFITVVLNSSARTIVAFTLTWTMTNDRGTEIEHSQHKYPDALTAIPGRGNEIHPGEQRIVPRGIEINCGLWGNEPTENFYLRQFAEWASNDADAKELRIEIDAAILDDGTLLGSDKSDLATDFAAYLGAKQDLYREIVDALDRGSSWQEAFRSVDAILSTKPRPDVHNPLWIYPRLAAEDANRWREAYGEGSVDLFRRAVRREPFVITRHPDS
jgi:hypothetical protein